VFQITLFLAVWKCRRAAKSFESNRAMHGAESYEPDEPRLLHPRVNRTTCCPSATRPAFFHGRSAFHKVRFFLTKTQTATDWLSTSKAELAARFTPCPDCGVDASELKKPYDSISCTKRRTRCGRDKG
jgi:hypothetical protein